MDTDANMNPTDDAVVANDAVTAEDVVMPEAEEAVADAAEVEASETDVQ